MSRCFHPHSHADSCLPQIAVELLCFSVTVLESPLTELPRLRIHERNLLNARVVITTYNQHIGSFLPSLGLVGTTQVYLGPGSRHCYEIIIITNLRLRYLVISPVLDTDLNLNVR